jgi:hypothetical protein
MNQKEPYWKLQNQKKLNSGFVKHLVILVYLSLFVFLECSFLKNVYL